MSRKSIATFGTLLFLIVSLSFLSYQRLHKPRILVIHSYHSDMPWVENLNQGINNVFSDKAYISLRYFYMNTKYQNNKRYMQQIQRIIKSTINSWYPDLILAFDHDAQATLLKLEKQGIKTPIIFAGISDEKLFALYNQKGNITGITEQVPVRAVREILSLLFRHQRRIYYLSDDSSAAQLLDKDIANSNWGSFELVEHKRVKTVQEWKKYVKEAEAKADILLVSLFHTLKDGKHTVNRKQLVHWMNHEVNIPVVGLYESFMIDGGLISIAISGLEQGYTAARIALDVVEKKMSIRDIPIIRGQTFSLFIEKEALTKRFPQVQVPVILEAFAQSHWNPQKLTTEELLYSKKAVGSFIAKIA
ncbi:ABC transporter substrate-binding protein [Legionella sp. W05-934-2]|uniref:ABC transporter substrate-binding protein n=1 Tax=Legionella sp. W05-934-2 TaxID=1198649 RepID=UPI0034627ED7